MIQLLIDFCQMFFIVVGLLSPSHQQHVRAPVSLCLSKILTLSDFHSSANIKEKGVGEGDMAFDASEQLP